jgi:hypothetical protein
MAPVKEAVAGKASQKQLFKGEDDLHQSPMRALAAIALK